MKWQISDDMKMVNIFMKIYSNCLFVCFPTDSHLYHSKSLLKHFFMDDVSFIFMFIISHTVHEKKTPISEPWYKRLKMSENWYYYYGKKKILGEIFSELCG